METWKRTWKKEIIGLIHALQTKLVHIANDWYFEFDVTLPNIDKCPSSKF